MPYVCSAVQENTRRTAQVNTLTVLEKNGTLGGKEKLNIYTEKVWKITKYRVLSCASYRADFSMVLKRDKCLEVY